MRRNSLEIINTIIFAITILGTNVLELFDIELGRTEMIAVSIILMIAYILVSQQKKFQTVHSFDEKSSSFRNFFQRWYAQPGQLVIFCDDLRWLGDSNSRLMNIFRAKRDRLYLYLRNPDTDRNAQALKRGGAKVFKVKESVRTEHRLSIMENDGIKKMVVRNKDLNSDAIVFIETNIYRDPYLIKLAEDMLNDCYEKPN